jgi:hypothetical protein
MEIIPPPLRGKKPNLKPIFIILIVIGASVGIIIPIVLHQRAQVVQKGFIFNGFSLKSSDNASESVTMAAEFQYTNDLGKKIQITSIDATFYYKAKNDTNWLVLFSLSDKNNVIVDLNNPANITGIFQLTNSKEDALKRFLFAEIIRKGEFTIRIQGHVGISPMEEVDDDFPTQLEMDIIKVGNETFKYDIQSNGVSTFLLVDIVTPGIDINHPNDYQIQITAQYKNSLPFAINFQSVNFSLINRTENANLGSFSFDHTIIGEINGSTEKNFTTTIFVNPNQMGWIVSDLLSDITDVVKMIDLKGTVKIGPVLITLEDKKQVIASSLKFELKITRYYAQGASLVLDVEFINPTGLVFNLTSIKMSMYVTGTIQKVVEIDKTGLWEIKPYKNTEVIGLVVNAEYSVFLQHINKNFDLEGYFEANSFNYNGIITFKNDDVDIIT